MLELIWLLDRSGSMVPDGNIQSVNTVLRELLPQVGELESGPAQLRSHALAFDSTVEWVAWGASPFAPSPWLPLHPTGSGLSEMGLAVDALRRAAHEGRIVTADPPPIVVVVSDGWWSDTASPSATDAIAAMASDPLTARWTRVSFPVGRDPETTGLGAFAGSAERVLPLSHPHRLVSIIEDQWSLAL